MLLAAAAWLLRCTPSPETGALRSDILLLSPAGFSADTVDRCGEYGTAEGQYFGEAFLVCGGERRPVSIASVNTTVEIPADSPDQSREEYRKKLDGITEEIRTWEDQASERRRAERKEDLRQQIEELSTLQDFLRTRQGEALETAEKELEEGETALTEGKQALIDAAEEIEDAEAQLLEIKAQLKEKKRSWRRQTVS